MTKKILITLVLVVVLTMTGCFFNFAQKVADPSFSPDAGEYEASTLQVTISSATSGAEIYYTLDGSMPEPDPNVDTVFLYNGPFMIEDSLTVKALAVKNGLLDSNVMEAAYVLLQSANEPPSVSLTQPDDNQEFKQGVDIVIKATATDDETVSSVFAYNGEEELGEMTSLALGPQGEGQYVYTLSAPALGTYDLYARATDNQGLSVKSNHARVSVVATTVAPQVRLVEPSSGMSWQLGATMNGIVETLDDNIAKVEIFEAEAASGGEIVPLAVATKADEITNQGWQTWTFTWTPSEEGTFEILARATDMDGLIAESERVPIEVVSFQVGPTISILAPESGSNYEFGSSVQFVMDAFDDGTVTSVDVVRQNGNALTLLCSAELTPSYLDNSNTWTCSWTPTSAGTYLGVYATATDDSGLTSQSDPITVEIVEGNVPPEVQITYPFDETSLVIQQGQTVVVDAIATDDMALERVEFYQDDTLMGDFSRYVHSPIINGPTHYFNWNPSAGNYQLTARAYDEEGETNVSAPINMEIVVTGGPSGSTSE